MEFFTYTSINWLAVPVGAILYMVIGGIWYGPIAGKAWMAEIGKTPEDFEGQNPMPAMIKSLIAAAFYSFGLALIIYNPALKVDSMQEGAMIGLFVSLLFTAAGTFPNYAFENKTMRHFLIHSGCSVLAMVLTGAMMAYWQ